MLGSPALAPFLWQTREVEPGGVFGHVAAKLSGCDVDFAVAVRVAFRRRPSLDSVKPNWSTGRGHSAELLPSWVFGNLCLTSAVDCGHRWGLKLLRHGCNVCRCILLLRLSFAEYPETGTVPSVGSHYLGERSPRKLDPPNARPGPVCCAMDMILATLACLLETHHKEELVFLNFNTYGFH